MSEKREISRATGIMGAATMMSRVAGLIRDMVVATLFGAGFATDAFFMAFTIPNLLRRFFAEGSLTAAFVPTFSEVYHRDGKKEALRVARIALTLLVLVMVIVTTLGILASPAIVRAIGFGFGAVEGKLALTNQLNQLMFPYLFFVSLLALVTGVLNVFGHYFLPSVSPVLLNLSMILSALILRTQFDVPITALAIGVLIGGAAQLLLQFPALRRKGITFTPAFNFRHPAVLRMAKLMVPGIAGVAIYQINIVVTRLLASFLPEGSVSYLYYGQRLFEFPQGIFIVSLAQAALPAMSRQVAAGDIAGMKESLRFSLSLIIIVAIPAAVGLMLCAVPIYSLFFMGGAFEYADVIQTSMALAAYAPGLLFVGISRVVAPTFYALKNTRVPVWASFWTLLVNAGAGVLLMGPLQHVGLALALTISAVFNALFLLWALRREAGRIEIGPVMRTMMRVLLPTVCMAGVVAYSLTWGVWDQEGAVLRNGVVLSAAIVSGGAVYMVGCLLMRVPEAASVLSLLRRRFQKGHSN